MNPIIVWWEDCAGNLWNVNHVIPIGPTGYSEALEVLALCGDVVAMLSWFLKPPSEGL